MTTWLQSQPLKQFHAAAAYTTVSDCVRATIRTNGFKGPFQGLGATLLRNAPANAVYLGSFEVMKDKMASYKGCKKTELPAPWVITAGGLGGLLYWLAIYPVDVVKSAIATDNIDPSKRKYPDMVTTYKVWTRLQQPPCAVRHPLQAVWGQTPPCMWLLIDWDSDFQTNSTAVCSPASKVVCC